MSDFKCNHYICKTCLIAEVNGGAPGCGDCYRCMNDKENDHPGQCTNEVTAQSEIQALMKREEQNNHANHSLYYPPGVR